MRIKRPLLQHAAAAVSVVSIVDTGGGVAGVRRGFLACCWLGACLFLFSLLAFRRVDGSAGQACERQYNTQYKLEYAIEHHMLFLLPHIWVLLMNTYMGAVDEHAQDKCS